MPQVEPTIEIFSLDIEGETRRDIFIPAKLLPNEGIYYQAEDRWGIWMPKSLLEYDLVKCTYIIPTHLLVMSEEKRT